MVNRDKTILFILILNQNVAGVSVKIHQAEIQDCNFMHLVFAKKVWREIFYRPLALDKLLERADLDLCVFFILFLGLFRTSCARADIKVLGFGCIKIFIWKLSFLNLCRFTWQILKRYQTWNQGQMLRWSHLILVNRGVGQAGMADLNEPSCGNSWKTAMVKYVGGNFSNSCFPRFYTRSASFTTK